MTIWTSVIFSIIHAITFFLYTANYAELRKNDRYAKSGKAQIEKMPFARKITKVAFSFGTLIVFLSFWVQNENYGFYSTSVTFRSFGLALAFIAFLFLKKSLDQLGENYSPLFDTHRPLFIVENGPYKVIRHPVYLCNMLIILGYVIAGSNIWVVITSLWGWGYMIRSILKEEKFLAQEFSNYKDYQKRTWRILPFIF
jgi:protein-S-isoprenylcysteine O-methyltransferase Ste14